MLLKSNLINWFICQDGPGSILKWKEGSISCRIAKTLVDGCNDKVPNRVKTSRSDGIILIKGPTYSYVTIYKAGVMAQASYRAGYEVNSCFKEKIKVKVADGRGAWFVR